MVLSDKEYIFLYGVLDDTIHSLDTFTPPQETQSLLIPTPPTAPIALPATPSPSPSPSPPPPTRNSTITLIVRIQVHSAVLQVHQNEHPLATFAINELAVSFEDGGKERDEDLLMRVQVSVQNVLLSDNRLDKASPQYQYIIAPKDRDMTMLNVTFVEYLYHFKSTYF